MDEVQQKKSAQCFAAAIGSETYYTSLKTDLLSLKSIWSHSFHCSSSLNHKHRSFVIFFWSCVTHVLISLQRCGMSWCPISSQFYQCSLASVLQTGEQTGCRWMWGVGQEAKCEILAYLIEPEGIWSSDVMRLDLKTAPDWSSIPSHRPRSLPKVRGRRHMGANTIQWVAERGLFSDHTLTTTAVLLFLLTLTRRILLLWLKLTFKCFSVKLTSCKKFGLESQCICYDVRPKCSEGSWESQAEHIASLISHQDGHERWYISNSKQVKLFPFNVASMHNEIISFSESRRCCLEGFRGQSVVICNRAIWALPALGTADGGQVYTAHTATPFNQHADMRPWKFPLCHDRIEG